VVTGMIYLITDIAELWNIVLVVYDGMSITIFGMLLLGIINNDEKNSGTIITLILFIIAFVLSFALFYSEEVFYVAVIIYYLAIITYYLANNERLHQIEKRKEAAK
ncbi:MAG: hypothetical protein ACTSYA_08065, partial [Candidatus Kariarchaeaceae archaeon]